MQKMEWFGVVRGLSRSSAMSPFDRAHTTSFLFDFNRNYVSILYRFRDIAGYLSKFADFDPPHLHSAPRRSVIPVESSKIFGVRKLESLGYRVVLFV